MSEEKFLMVSLEEEQAKSIAKILASKTSRKILDYLSTKKEASESDVSKALKIPLSTAHYNLKHLKKAGLIEVKEFIWSKKGREIDLYRIAKKHIIISPKGTSLTKETLKKLIPVALFSGAISIAMHIYNKSKFGLGVVKTATFQNIDKAVEFAAEESGKAAPTLERAMDGVMAAGAQAAPQVTETLNQTVTKEIFNIIVQSQPSYALWFFLGALVALGIYFLITLIRKR